jgi:hypothetical protein
MKSSREENLMKHAFNVLAVFLLTTGAARLAVADTAPQTMPAHVPGLREQMRELQQQAMLQRDHHSQPQPQMSEQQMHDGNVDTTSTQEQGPDDVSRGRMSPEERRALRRQIDEAGHELYAPSR